MGFVLNEVANPVPGTGDRDHRAEHEQLARMLPPDQFPNLTRLLPSWPSATPRSTSSSASTSSSPTSGPRSAHRFGSTPERHVTATG